MWTRHSSDWLTFGRIQPPSAKTRMAEQTFSHVREACLQHDVGQRLALDGKGRTLSLEVQACDASSAHVR